MATSSSNIGAEEKAFKKLFLQRSVLDTLRVYIDPNQDFLDQMEKKQLLTEDELFVVKGLRWPSNRNELLQILIKKPWNQNTFDNFCGVLKSTQDAKLTETMVQKAGDFMQGLQEELREIADPYTSTLDVELGAGGLNLQAKNAIKTLLRDKDTEISRLKTENDELRMNVKNTQEERNNFHERFNYLDRALMDWFAALEMEADHEKIEHSLAEVKTRMLDQKKKITHLEEENQQFQKTLHEMKTKTRILTEENIELKTWRQGEMVANQTERRENAELVSSLKEKLQLERDKIARLERQLQRVESLNIESCRISETELTNLKKKLSETIKQLNTVAKERDAAREEMMDIHDKTRKLLFKLNLSNEIEDVGLSLEHARNIVYNRRGRRGSSLQNTDNATPLIPNGSMTSTTPRRFSAKGPSPIDSPRPDRLQLSRPTHNSPVINEAVSVSNSSVQNDKEGDGKTCKVCGKAFQESTNFEGACISHPQGASKLHEGTELEVWSCCRSRDTIKGCQLTRHIPFVEEIASILSSIKK